MAAIDLDARDEEVAQSADLVSQAVLRSHLPMLRIGAGLFGAAALLHLVVRLMI